VNFLQNDANELRLPTGITYLTFDTFKQLSLKEGVIDPEKSLLIIDEVDSLLFQTPHDFEGLQRVFKPFTKLIGLTGSDLKDFHKQAAQSITQATIIKFNAGNQAKPSLVCLG
jgi:hypothetical protein